MKKDFGVKTWLYPMPVLMLATYTACSTDGCCHPTLWPSEWRRDSI